MPILILQKFTAGGIESGGYSIAKFGNVVLTRMFPHFKPKPSEDGVKAFALCPFAVPTKLVLDEYEKDMSPEDAKRKVAKMIHDASKNRMLTKEEVGEAMVHSLRRDVDGSVYLVFPDLPLIEVPDSGPPLVTALYAVGRVATSLGKDSLSKREVKVILFVLLYVGFYVLHNFLMLILSLLF